MIMISSFLHSIRTFFRLLCKFVSRLFTNRGEIERICISSGPVTAKTMMLFSNSYKNSSKLSTYSKIIFYPKLFSINAAYQNLVDVKRISPISNDDPRTSIQLMHFNIKSCLGSLRFVNAVYTAIETLQKTTVDLISQTKNHNEMLETFWNKMMPDTRRNMNSDWGDVGFQGLDPTTDFRGMGLLGLSQLVYLSSEHNVIARDILADANHPRRYYPFAATGINISAFVFDLLKGRHLHARLFQALESYSNSNNISGISNAGLSDSIEIIDIGCKVIHEVYCDVFKRFSYLWQERDPKNIMEFQSIFGIVKIEFKNKYKSF